MVDFNASAHGLTRALPIPSAPHAGPDERPPSLITVHNEFRTVADNYQSSLASIRNDLATVQADIANLAPTVQKEKAALETRQGYLVAGSLATGAVCVASLLFAMVAGCFNPFFLLSLTTLPIAAAIWLPILAFCSRQPPVLNQQAALAKKHDQLKAQERQCVVDFQAACGRGVATAMGLTPPRT